MQNVQNIIQMHLAYERKSQLTWEKTMKRHQIQDDNSIEII